MQCDHDGFTNRGFRGWKRPVARPYQAGGPKPVTIDGVSFPALEVGFAWYDPETAIADAKTQIDQLKLKRYATAGQISQAEQSAA